jgi:hypothetical protein
MNVRRHFFFLLWIVLLSAEAATLRSQAPLPPTPATAPLTHPGDIYKQAMHPLDLVRSSFDNWSDAELGALSVAMRVARQACVESKPEAYSGEDLYELARLCSLGQQWGAANTIALQYIASGAEAHRTQAYILSMNSLMRAGDTIAAIWSARLFLYQRKSEKLV